ncbi:hypothetical protein FHT76_008207 [Rhizobium sp. BK176]|nr:hypothetical protein [Rhizobium sp. BK399]MCS3743335.1 hypothetical protein [Rhizobium sp. BK661]MCS4096485.1 hypothetical protein [Rhizobium sp. BK176]
MSKALRVVAPGKPGCWLWIGPLERHVRDRLVPRTDESPGFKTPWMVSPHRKAALSQPFLRRPFVLNPQVGADYCIAFISEAGIET